MADAALRLPPVRRPRGAGRQLHRRRRERRRRARRSAGSSCATRAPGGVSSRRGRTTRAWPDRFMGSVAIDVRATSRSATRPRDRPPSRASATRPGARRPRRDARPEQVMKPAAARRPGPATAGATTARWPSTPSTMHLLVHEGVLQLDSSSSWRTAIGRFSLPTCPPPPRTTLGKHPTRRTHRRAARITFTASGVATTFRCKLDRRAFERCRSPKGYRT